jgi:hypothetical protein
MVYKSALFSLIRLHPEEAGPLRFIEEILIVRLSMLSEYKEI